MLLDVEDLSVHIGQGPAAVTPVRDVSFSIGEAEILGLAGESGSGKTLTALGAAQLLPKGGVVTAERLELAGRNLLDSNSRGLASFLGTRLGMVFQDPMTSLNPARHIGSQMIEGVRAHSAIGRKAALQLAEERLSDTGIRDARLWLGRYPHELSGGMRQRVMIAMAMMHTPELIIADEPTTALDVTIQAQIAALISALNAEYGTAFLLISHNLALLSEICDRIMVMYAGRLVEVLPGDQLAGAEHPYTRALLDAVPSLDSDAAESVAGIPGSAPPASVDSPGCAFAPRCPVAEERCEKERPMLEDVGAGRQVACHVVARQKKGFSHD